MTTHHYSAAFRRYWLVVVAAAAIAGMGAFALSQAATPAYTATAKLYFSLSDGGSATDLNQGSNYIQSQMLSYAELATSPTVLQPVIEELELELSTKGLAEAIAVATLQNTAVLEVGATNGSAADAAKIANAIAANLADTVKDVEPKTPEEGTSVRASIIAPATEPGQPSSPNTPRNLLAGVLIGLIIGVLTVVLRERFDTRVRTVEDLAGSTDAPLLGVVEANGARSHGTPDTNPITESYRRLCARLDSAPGSTKPLTLLVTSATARERKSPITLGIASAFAERGRRVLVVDSDIRNPQIARLTGLDNTSGLAAVLAGEVEASDAIQRWDAGNVDVLVSGAVPARPGEMLASTAVPSLFKKLSPLYNVLIIDAAAVNTVADAMILGRHVQGAVVVADAAKVHRADLILAVDALSDSHVKVKGTVLNLDRKTIGSTEHHDG